MVLGNAQRKLYAFRESATEKNTLQGNLLVRVKWCGKSAPTFWRQNVHCKPHQEQDQIGTKSVSMVVYDQICAGRSLEIGSNANSR
jgi:hypothetical protein